MASLDSFHMLRPVFIDRTCKRCWKKEAEVNHADHKIVDGQPCIVWHLGHVKHHRGLPYQTWNFVNCEKKIINCLNILWRTKRVKNTDVGQPVFQKYRPTRKIRVDLYFMLRPLNASRPVKYGSTCNYTGRPVFVSGTPVFEILFQCPTFSTLIFSFNAFMVLGIEKKCKHWALI